MQDQQEHPSLHGHVPIRPTERSVRWGEVRKFVELVKTHGRLLASDFHLRCSASVLSNPTEFANLLVFLQEYGSLFRHLELFSINEEPHDDELLVAHCATLVRFFSKVDEISIHGRICPGYVHLVTERTKKVTFVTDEAFTEAPFFQACLRYRCLINLCKPIVDDATAVGLSASGLVDNVDFFSGVPTGRYDLIAMLRARHIGILLRDEPSERLFIGSVLRADAGSSLQELHLSGLSITCVSDLIASLARLPQLSALHMHECRVSLTDLRCLEMPRLRELRFVTAPALDCRDLKALSMLTNLEELSWEGHECSSSEFLGEYVATFLPRLQNLSWNPSRLDSKLASALAGHRHLTKLKLMGRPPKGPKETTMALQVLCKETRIRSMKLHLSVNSIADFKQWLMGQPDVALERLELGSYYVLDVNHRKKRRSDYITTVIVIMAAYQRSLAGTLQALPPELVENILVHTFPAEYLNRKTTDLEKAFQLIWTHVMRAITTGAHIKPLRLIERRQDPWDLQVKQ